MFCCLRFDKIWSKKPFISKSLPQKLSQNSKNYPDKIINSHESLNLIPENTYFLPENQIHEIKIISNGKRN